MENGRLELGKDVERAFSARVKGFRLARGLTQEELAVWMTDAGYPMHQTTVAKLESGGRPTPVGEVAALAVLFNVPVSAFFVSADDVTIHMELARSASVIATQARELVELDERASRLRLEHAAARARHTVLERQTRELEAEVEAEQDALTRRASRARKRSN